MMPRVIPYKVAPLAAMVLLATSAWGQAPAAGKTAAIEEVVVTARKREESLQEIPITMSAFGRDQLEAANMVSLDDVSQQTPGFQFKSQANQAPGRYNTALYFRGLTSAQFSPSFATGALFIDGVYVLNGGTAFSLTDLERVEVIKGPQAAYFGRNTFGGAVNLITRNPDLEEFGGEVSGSTTSRSNNDVSVFFEGPIVKDMLGFSISVREYDKEGHYTATDGGRLGNESTSSYSGVLYFQPTDSLNLKFRASRSEDSDGAPAGAYISGFFNDSCSGKTIDSPEGPVSPALYICGEVPDIRSAISQTGRLLGSNTQLTDAARAILTDPAGGLPGTPFVGDIGLRRIIERYSLTLDWDIGDFNVAAIYGKNDQGTNWIRDFDLSEAVNGFSSDPQLMDDESYEIRITGPQDGRFKWMVGYNHYEQKFTSSGAGGNFISECVNFVPGPPVYDIATSSCTFFPFPNSFPDSDKADVEGYFAAIDYAITDELTLVLEGRNQNDTLTKGAGVRIPGAPVLQESFKDFLPRVILRWQPNDDTNIYGIYSQGQIAGEFNSLFINSDARERQQFVDANPAIAEELPAEKLDGYEIGVKKTLLDGRAQVNLAFFMYDWEGVKGRSTANINQSCRAGDIDNPRVVGCATADGAVVGGGKIIPGTSLPLFSASNVLLPGDAEIKGFELESQFAATENLMLTFNMAYINSEYTDYEFNFVSAFAGFSQMRGNQTPRQAKVSGNASATYSFTLGDLPAHIRGDVFYQGKAYVDESNLAYVGDYYLANLRAGVNTDEWMVEAFIDNVFDEDAWVTGSRWTDFASPLQFAYFSLKQGVAVSAQDRREIGLRATYRW